MLLVSSVLLSLFAVAANESEAENKSSRSAKKSLEYYRFSLSQGQFNYAVIGIQGAISSLLSLDNKPEDKDIPCLPQLVKMLIETYELAGQLPEAAKNCGYVLAEPHRYAVPAELQDLQLQMLSMRAWANVMEGNAASAFSDLEAIKQNPVYKARVGQSFMNTEERISEGAALTLVGQYDRARVLLDDVIKQFVNFHVERDWIYSRAFLWRSRLNLACGDAAAAMDDALKSGEVAGQSPTARLIRARSLTQKSVIQLKLGKTNLAIKAAEDAIQEFKYLPEAYVQLASSQFSAGNNTETEAALTSATALFGSLPAIVKAQAALVKTEPKLAVDAAKTEAPALGSGPIKDKWALVVGISKFSDPSLNLKYSAKDARDFAEYLVREANFAPDHVKLLVDGESTREKILENLADKWLPHAAKPGDLVVLYLSTHASPDSQENSGLNYLFASDTKVDLVQAGGIALQDLIRILKTRIHTDRIVVILDACHSGAAQSQAKGLHRSDSSAGADTNTNANADGSSSSFSRLSQDTKAVVISSSQSNERSWELLDQANSAFTYFLLQGLRSKGAKTTLKEAFDFMKMELTERIIKERGLMQTPLMMNSQSGNELILATPVKN